eukprot:GEZU01005080.1.p2 GENE.GEZU01005080.1~~GEZU01005080.1.p2  ORF type:complete len:113 (-),score=35.84 GEZU01005080.1:29-367(-)
MQFVVNVTNVQLNSHTHMHIHTIASPSSSSSSQTNIIIAIYYGHVYDDPTVVQGTKAVKELELHLGDYVAMAWGVLMCIVLLWEVLTDNTCFRRLKFKIGNEIRKRKYAQPQ